MTQDTDRLHTLADKWDAAADEAHAAAKRIVLDAKQARGPQQDSLLLVAAMSQAVHGVNKAHAAELRATLGGDQ